MNFGLMKRMEERKRILCIYFEDGKISRTPEEEEKEEEEEVIGVEYTCHYFYFIHKKAQFPLLFKLYHK